MTSRSIIAAALLAVCAPLAGCATDTKDTPDDPATGQLVFPLLQSGPDGALYHLSNATFDIVDLNSGTTQTVDGSGNQSTVGVFLQPRTYSVALRDGWVLEKSSDGGSTFQPVSALLGSPNPSGFRVLANQPVIVEFDFLIRDTFGTLEIRLGVIPKPRELAGGVIIDTATDGLAGYADPANHLLDFGIFFSLASLQSVTLPDGTKQHVYTAGPSGTPGPLAPDGSAVAGEFYNDNLGTLAGVVGPGLTGGSLQYTVSAKPDGTFELVGQLFGDGTELDFGPSTIDAVTAPSLGPDGFPKDEFFYDSGSPFTLFNTAGTLTGTLRVRHLVP